LGRARESKRERKRERERERERESGQREDGKRGKVSGLEKTIPWGRLLSQRYGL